MATRFPNTPGASRIRYSQLNTLNVNNLDRTLVSQNMLRNITSDNINSTNLNVVNITGINGYFTNLVASGTSIISTNLSLTNLNVVNLTGNNASIASLQSSGISVLNFTGTNVSVLSLTKNTIPFTNNQNKLTSIATGGNNCLLYTDNTGNYIWRNLGYIGTTSTIYGNYGANFNPTGMISGVLQGNTYMGVNSGRSEIDGAFPVDRNNIFIGNSVAQSFKVGQNNTAFGANVFTSNSSGGSNSVAIGSSAMSTLNGVSISNIGVGYNINSSNAGVTDNYNIGIGAQTLGILLTTGTNNIAIGHYTAGTGVNLTTGRNNTLLGYSSITTANSAIGRIAIGSLTAPAVDNSCYIGNPQLTLIRAGGVTGTCDLGNTGNPFGLLFNKGIQMFTGLASDCRAGQVVLSGATTTVGTTAVTAKSLIFLSSIKEGGTPGFLRISAIVAGTSFTIKSSSGVSDTSTVSWMIVEPFTQQ